MTETTRKLEYAFRTNALDYVFIINPDTARKENQEYKKGNWIPPQGEIEVYVGPADGLRRIETDFQGNQFYIPHDGEFKFPSEYPGSNDVIDFQIASAGGGRGGFNHKIQVNRLDPVELPKDLFELLNVPAPVSVTFALQKPTPEND